MRLTDFSDYSLRLLMYAAAQNGRLITIEGTAELYGISRAHLMKVANQLTRAGFLDAVRGRSGGLRLAKPAGEIRLGDVLADGSGCGACAHSEDAQSRSQVRVTT
jgi:Rrf2 family nitric oxide-sensitive transcriptional repressor